MSLDLSTTLSVVGVALTVLFFVIGYRQTIGARKERAKAANRQVTEALFRRLALDEGFYLDRQGIEKLLVGSALGASVRADDLYTSEEMEAVLYTKAIETDYLDSAKRSEVMERLGKCFKEPPENSSVVTPRTQRGGLPADVWLAVASGLTAMVLSAAAVPLTGVSFAEILDRSGDMTTVVLTVLGLVGTVAATAGALTAFTRVREKSFSIDDHRLDSRHSAILFERNLIDAAKRRNNTVQIAKRDECDFFYLGDNGNIAVEIKLDVNRVMRSSLKMALQKLEALCMAGTYTSAFIVGKNPPSSSIKKLETENVKIIDAHTLLGIIGSQRKRDE